MHEKTVKVRVISS